MHSTGPGCRIWNQPGDTAVLNRWRNKEEMPTDKSTVILAHDGQNETERDQGPALYEGEVLERPLKDNKGWRSDCSAPVQSHGEEQSQPKEY
jgi:hypothetical protein